MHCKDLYVKQLFLAHYIKIFLEHGINIFQNHMKPTFLRNLPFLTLGHSYLSFTLIIFQYADYFNRAQMLK